MRKIRYNVITFPGSNCDHDAQWVAQLSGADCEMVWHKDSSLLSPDVVIIPGGFSYGDYLRCGAIAKYSTIMNQVIKFANDGGLVIGICNGFQILTESGLLPGALMMNDSLHFICQHQYVRVENTDTPFTNAYRYGDIVDMPIAHKEGCYYIDPDGLKRLSENGQIAFRYCDADGTVDTTKKANPNGSVDNIAGIINHQGNVLGMMPHPERSAEPILPLKHNDRDKEIAPSHGMTLFSSINKWIYEKL
jgi:phosphoribosylformylglycinamidine synthase